MNRILFLLCFFALTAVTVTAQRRPVRRPPPPPENTRSLVDSQLYIPVEDVFVVQGRGIAITGRISTGSVTPGTRIELKGFRAEKKVLIVSEVNVRGATVPRAAAGDYVGLVFANGITLADVQRGMVMTEPGFAGLEAIATVKIKFLASGFSSFRDGDLGTFHLNGADVPNCEFVLPDRNVIIRPGMELEFNVHFPVQVVLLPKLDICVRSNGRILGCGKVTMY
jgi:translation elongation factor EF-Tu-like GTPase